MKRVFLILLLILLTILPALAVTAANMDVVSTNDGNRTQAATSDIFALRRDIRAVLTDSRFNYPDRWGWLKKLWLNICKWWAMLNKPKKPIDNSLLGKLLEWAGLACLAVFPLLLIYFLAKMFRRSGAVAPLSKSGPVQQVRSEDLKSQAAILADKGQFREAIRLLYLAGLEHLKMNGILPDGIRRTDKANINIVNHIFGPGNPGCQAFKELILVFQEKWYGLRNCKVDDYNRLIAALKIMETNMGKPHV